MIANILSNNVKSNYLQTFITLLLDPSNEYCYEILYLVLLPFFLVNFIRTLIKIIPSQLFCRIHLPSNLHKDTIILILSIYNNTYLT